MPRPHNLPETNNLWKGAAMTMKLYKCWFPTKGENMAVARHFSAENHASAAESAARRRCWDDVEWEDHLVCVSASGLEEAQTFDVQFESRPHFTAIRSS